MALYQPTPTRNEDDDALISLFKKGNDKEIQLNLFVEVILWFRVQFGKKTQHAT